MADDDGRLRRWAAAHAASLTLPANSPTAGTLGGGTAGGRRLGAAAGRPAGTPVPVVLSAFTEVDVIETGFPTNAVAWATHPDDRPLLAACCGDGCVRIWDYDQRAPMVTIGTTRSPAENPQGSISWGRQCDDRWRLAISATGFSATWLWEPGGQPRGGRFPGHYRNVRG
jgi:hypothetical protein